MRQNVRYQSKGIPMAVVPCVNAAYARHPRLAVSPEALRVAGVRVLYGAGWFEPNPPGERRPYPWGPALEALDGLVRRPGG
ncbi:hypothetical protein NX801_16890 [Streptomyces sp. LP05-1]|uniref:Uncharacterized protein n=1 Tax=Streptomyces pyxinae TaxID=2970734 RepID=A0ABT2CIR9_9ACTN|nr:hypothetical protein [Streptomyces sp. LP05-1]MCS0637310.1 hypothetical protein [Streptomyces sp. LP05-1]